MDAPFTEILLCSLSADDANTLNGAPQLQQQQQQQQLSEFADAPYSSSNAVTVVLMIVCAFNLVFVLVGAMHCMRHRRLLRDITDALIIEPSH